MGIISTNYPETTLLDNDHELEAPGNSKDRYRYSIEERTRLYSGVLQQIKKHGDATIDFGAETPELWKALGADPVNVY